MRAIAAAVRDPVLERDFLRLAARPAHFRNRTLTAVLVGALLLIVYGTMEGRGSPDELGRVTLAVLVLGSAACAGLLSYQEAILALCSERAAGTLPVLLTVPRTPLALARGLYLSRLLVALASVLSILPLAGMAMLFGGVSLREVLFGALVVVATAAFAGACGLLGGREARDGRAAEAGGGKVVAAVLAAPALLALAGAILPFAEETGFLSDAAAFLFRLTPLPSLWAFFEGTVGMRGRPLESDALHALLGAAAAALGAVLLTARTLAREDERSSLSATRPPARQEPLPLFGARPRSRRTPVGENPLAWREGLLPRRGTERFLFRIAPWLLLALCLFVFAFPIFAMRVGGDRGDEVFYTLLAGTPLFLATTALMGSASSLLAGERERGTLEVLRVTPLTGRDVVLGAFLGAWTRSRALLLASGVAALAGAVTGLSNPLFYASLAIGCALVGAFLALFAVLATVRARTFRVAKGRVAGILGAAFLAWPLLAALSRLPGPPAGVSEGILAFDPPVSLMGPLLLAYHAVAGLSNEGLSFALLGTAGAVAYGIAAAVLWRRLPGRIDRALAEEGA